jgi:hypothetical protein
MGESDINEINYIDIDITLASGNPTTNIVWSNNAANMGVIFCRNATKVLIHASNMLNQTI